MKILKFRRRREGSTNYSHRLRLVKGKKPRLVVRITSRYVIAHIVEYQRAGDVTISHANSKDLSEYGWIAGRNLPSAYLTGYLLGKHAKVKECILDAGVKSPHHKGRVYAVIKGAIDAGMNIPHDEKILPDKDRLTGKHINEKLVDLFETVKKKIDGVKKDG